jgi:hypothetical protein
VTGDGEQAPPTRATVWVEGGPVTILPKRAPVGNSGPIRGRTLAIFPTTDRAGLPPDIVVLSATLEPGSQPGLAVPDLLESEARAMCAALGVTAILFWDGRRARILACD